MGNRYYPFMNLPLPYPYHALEPYIDTRTMRLHHDRHLQTYVNNLNAALKDQPALQEMSLEQLVTRLPDDLPPDVRRTVHNNAGGVYNHRFFFDGLTNPSKRMPIGSLAGAIHRDFGGFEAFRKAFTAAALSVFGSGYAWLVVDNGTLKIVTTANQDTPLENGLCPILTVDVWEHAYYLKHYNDRARYLHDFFRVIDWHRAEQNYRTCTEKI